MAFPAQDRFSLSVLEHLHLKCEAVVDEFSVKNYLAKEKSLDWVFLKAKIQRVFFQW